MRDRARMTVCMHESVYMYVRMRVCVCACICEYMYASVFVCVFVSFFYAAACETTLNT